MKCLVLGLGRSGISATNLLVKQMEVFAFDDKKTLGQELLNAKILDEKIKILKKISKKTLKNIDFVVLSPGIEEKRIKKFLSGNTKIFSEIEVAFNFLKGEVLAITGTNGKTTTTSFLGEIFKNAKKKSFVVGNIGTPFSEKVLDGDDRTTFVCEVSSFQLEHIEKFKPKIVGFLNIENDHLDRYKNFENYFLAKQNIFKNMTQDDTLVLNYDDIMVKNLKSKTNANVLYFSLSKLPKGFFGAYKDKNKIIFNFEEQEETLSLEKCKLIGKHNISNILCASLMAKIYGIKNLPIQKTIERFNGVEHRIEFVLEKNGVKYFNDSKSTTVHSTLIATKSFKENLVLLIGGSDKNDDFISLFQKLPTNVSKIITFGKTGKKLYKIAKKFDFFDVFFAKSLFDAFNLTQKVIANEKVVLLSPACASFDEFSSFEERGQYFKGLVRDLED